MIWPFKRREKAPAVELPDVERFSMAADKDGWRAEATLGGAAVKHFAMIAVDWFRETGGKNYITMEFTDTRDGEMYELTVQRKGGKSPAGEISALRHDLERCMARELALMNPTANNPDSKHG